MPMPKDHKPWLAEGPNRMAIKNAGVQVTDPSDPAPVKNTGVEGVKKTWVPDRASE